MKTEKRYSEGLSGLNIQLTIGEMGLLKEIAHNCLNILTQKRKFNSTYDEQINQLKHLVQWVYNVVQDGESVHDCVESLGFKDIREHFERGEELKQAAMESNTDM